MSNIREDLLKRATSEITSTVQLRDRTSSLRAAQGTPTPEISICLGSGRCMFPADQGNAERCCPFCMRVAPTATLEQALEQVRIFVGGN